MAIPRNIKGVNPAQIKKNGSYMSEHQDAFLQSDEDLSLPDLDGEIEELPDLDDVFQADDSHPEKASVFDEVKNLDEDELDKLLGIDDLDDDQSERISFKNNENDTAEEENEELPEIEIDLDNPIDFDDDLTIDIGSDDSDDDFIVEKDSELILTDEDDDNSSPTDLSEDDIENEDLLLIDDNDPENEDSEDFEFIFDVDNSDDDDDESDEDDETDSEIENILFEDDDDSPDSVEDDDEEFVLEIDDEDDNDSFIFFEDDEDNDESDDEETFVFEELDDADENSDNDEAFMNIDEDEEYIPDESEILPVQSLSKKKQKDKNEDNQEENNNSDTKKPSDDDKNNNNFLNNLLNRLKLMKEQISADLKGDEIPESLTDEDEDDKEQETEDSNNENNSNKKGKNRAASKAANPFKKLFQLKIFSPIIKLYKMVVNVCFGVLNFVLGILSKLPIVGKFLKPVLAASKTLQKIATFMPIILVILILVLLNIFLVPRNYESTDLPDGAALTISDFSYDGETASATVANTGEIILDNVEIEFEIYSMQPNANPKTWIIPQPSSKCSTQVETIDIEGEVEISASCGFEKGKFPRATAHVKQ